MTAAASGSSLSQPAGISTALVRSLVEQGYEVIVEPGIDQLPATIARFRPDLLAKRGDERLVIEVKREGGTGPKRRLPELANAIGKLPNWRLEIAVAGDEKSEYSHLSWTAADVIKRVEEASQLVDKGYDEAGLLLLSAAAEAAGRIAGHANGLALQSWAPHMLFKQLAHEGLVDQEDLVTLEHSRTLRNRLSHGFVPDESIGPVVARLSEVTRRLIAEAMATH